MFVLGEFYVRALVVVYRYRAGGMKLVLRCLRGSRFGGWGGDVALDNQCCFDKGGKSFAFHVIIWLMFR